VGSAGAVPRLMLGHEVLKAMQRHFLTHDFSLAGLRRTLQTALLLHFQSQPLSHLTACAWHGDDAAQAAQAAVKQLTPTMLHYAKKQLKSLRLAPAATPDATRAALAAALAAATPRYRRWALGLRALHMTAAAACLTHTHAATLRELLRDASAADFARSAGAAFVGELTEAVERLPPAATRQLLGASLPVTLSSPAPSMDLASNPGKRAIYILREGEVPAAAPNETFYVNTCDSAA
jgi:hypothetical protein